MPRADHTTGSTWEESARLLYTTSTSFPEPLHSAEPASPPASSVEPVSLETSTVAPHPMLASYVLVHYLGLALRVLGLAILLAVLLR
jgi:hypothetical protein